MGDPRDVTAMRLEEAEDALKPTDWRIAQVVRTDPPGERIDAWQPRVVRQRVIAPGQLELVVSHAPSEPADAERAP